MQAVGNALSLAVMGLGALLSAQPAEEPGAGTAVKRPEPCYVVIAVDISGSMESRDKGLPTQGSASGDSLTLREEGQLAFLQLLPFVRSDLYIGVAHFADRVRFARPSRETGPLLPWGQTFLNESACRNLVQSASFQVPWRADIAEGLSWAADRIRAARQQYGQGPAKLILLSNGDPRDSAREMERGRGPLLSLGKQFAEQQIQVYPILLGEVSSRAGAGPFRPAGREAAAEDLMHSVAVLTGGKAYRLSPEFGFADILMDVFDLGTQVQGDLVVSRHDWAIVAVGAPLESMVVEPSGSVGPRTMALDDRLEAASGIRARVISARGSRTTVLRRPGTRELVNRFWQGRWRLGSPDEKSRPAVRLYRIPDYLVQLEMIPGLPWWLNEQVQWKAHLLERHQETPALPKVAGADGAGLSVRMKAVLAEGKDAFVVDRGRWTIPGRLYETEPFTVRAPGLYTLSGEVWHTIGEVNAPVGHFTGNVYVHPACVGLAVVRAATNDVLLEPPPTATTLQVEAQGGQEIYFRISGKGEFQVEPMSGVVRLAVPNEGVRDPCEPPGQSQWPFRKEDGGALLAGPIRLTEQEERLMGSVAVEVRTFAGVRQVRFPAFELIYAPAPIRLECRFTDPREALWVGELHRQPVTVTAFPVFDRLLDQALGLFPETLSGVHIRTMDLRSGTTQVIDPNHRLLERPQPGGSAGRTVTATYFLESTVPIPPADKCEIDLSSVGEGLVPLQGVIKSYAVVDPVAKGLFEWIVQQGGPAPREGPVSETLFCGEPALFFAEWRPDLNVSAVRFEIPQPGLAGALFVDLPVTPETNRAQLQHVVSGLTPGQTVPIYAHVTMRPANAEQALHLKLYGGQFRAEDRRIVLEELTVGDGTPTDVPGYVWEPVEVPLRARFRGYKAEDAAHHAALEDFKKSCVVTVTSSAGDATNITNRIEWTSMTPAEGAAKTCWLTGHVRYTPEILGRAAIELSARAPLVRGATGPASQRAYVHVLAKEPRLAILVHRLKPGGEEPLFDSRQWITGHSSISPLMTRLSTRLRVDIQSVGWAATGQAGPWQTTLRLLRRPSATADWTTVFSDTSELTAGEPLRREVQIAENGQYALEVVGQDRLSSRATARVLTPILASIQPHEVQPALAPPAWLTARVRQWPFEYLVTLHQDAVDLSQPQALAFQFQLPGQEEVWLDGAASPVGLESLKVRQLSARAPRLLPASEGLRNGVARFRVSAQGLEVLRWECPNVRVVPPVLESLALSRENAGAALASSGGTLTLDGRADLWVRPVFRAAPELEGQWAVSKTMVYLWRDSSAPSAGGPADVRVLERLQERGKSAAAGPGIHAFEIDNTAGAEAVRVLPRRAAHGFWGWPKKAVSEQYSLIASVLYRPPRATEASAPAPTLPALAEWSDLYAIHLDAPWVVPWCWWPVGALLLMAAGVTVLRVLVPSPSRLALDLRLEDNVAIVEPVRLDNPVLVDLRETSLAEEFVLYTRYLCGRWESVGRKLARQANLPPESRRAAGLGESLRAAATVAAPVWILLRRGLYPRRRAWAAIIPRIRGDAALVRTGLLCVWTGLRARHGRVWSSQAGSLALPEEGQTRSINLDLPYRIDSVDRTMRVTVRVRRMVAEEMA